MIKRTESESEPKITRSCVRCVAFTRGGQRCKRQTCVRKNYCWQHLRTDKHLMVAKSLIPDAGLGLYTLREKRKGDPIADYTGKVTYERKGRYRILLNQKEGKVLASNDTQDAVGRYANTCNPSVPGVCSGNNAKYAINRRTKPPSATIRATKRINSGGEVYVDYGRQYWR